MCLRQQCTQKALKRSSTALAKKACLVHVGAWHSVGRISNDYLKHLAVGSTLVGCTLHSTCLRGLIVVLVVSFPTYHLML